MSSSTGVAPTGKKISTIDGKTLTEVYLKRVEIGANDPAHMVKKDGKYTAVTWGQIHEQVLALVAAYRKFGFKTGDRICIFSNTCPRWHIADLANYCAGLVTVPIYHSSTAEDIAYLLEHCEGRAVFTEDEKLAGKLQEAFKTTKRPIPIIVFADGKASAPGLTAFETLLEATPQQRAEAQTYVQEVAKEIGPESMASIVYTSGTTGQPKGVVLTHHNFASEIRSFIDMFEVGQNDMTLAFLPFAHILGRVESTLPIFSGITLGFAESINAVAQNLQELRPTILISVPRIYEKIYARIQGEVAAAPPLKKKIFDWAVSTGRQVARLRSERKAIPLALTLKHQVADQLVLSKIRQKLGGNLRFTVSGGAPLAEELCEFFHACGIGIMEGYGLTETTAAITLNHLADFGFGSVGKPLGGAEIRIAADGEILSRGPTVFKEYYKNPSATAEVFSGDGWFHTGDIGEINSRGQLRITDRKKELIVTSAGKNIAPQKLENMLKQLPLISNAMVYGDKQKYLVGLVTLNDIQLKEWAEREGLPSGQVKDLVSHQKLIDQIEDEIKEMNRTLASYETIKKFVLLPTDFAVETGELTPSLKLKRKVLVQKYQSYIDALYA